MVIGKIYNGKAALREECWVETAGNRIIRPHESPSQNVNLFANLIIELVCFAGARLIPKSVNIIPFILKQLVKLSEFRHFEIDCEDVIGLEANEPTLNSEIAAIGDKSELIMCLLVVGDEFDDSKNQKIEAFITNGVPSRMKAIMGLKVHLKVSLASSELVCVLKVYSDIFSLFSSIIFHLLLFRTKNYKPSYTVQMQ